MLTASDSEFEIFMVKTTLACYRLRALATSNEALQEVSPHYLHAILRFFFFFFIFFFFFFSGNTYRLASHSRMFAVLANVHFFWCIRRLETALYRRWQRLHG